MERCANEMNVTQENLENYIRIDDIATTEEMSLNIEDAIDNIIEHDPAPEEEEDGDLGGDTVGTSSTITTYKTTEEMSLNIEDAIDNIIEHDPAPEEEEDGDLGGVSYR
ncbi:hypothetical protein QE152_g10689 [Popillia japonica]|uniref:Uncharacterized protein n=1 Tax=Popillia japonica TaxID=7064 RepID=A0AAW1LU67_POPJA